MVAQGGRLTVEMEGVQVDQAPLWAWGPVRLEYLL